MGWKMVIKPYTTAEMTGTPTVSQRFRLSTTAPKAFLEGVSVGAVFYNDPTFTAVHAEIWSDRAGSPIRLLATSDNSFTKAEVVKVSSALKIYSYAFMGFSFATPYPLVPGAYYHVVFRASGYTGTTSAFVASRHGYPDPQYLTGVTLTLPKAAKFPFEVGFMTAGA